jgi:crossover junction endodeoxyribonuclease RusA
MEIEFPIEFLVKGTPVSLQAKRSESREEWKERVKAASATAVPQPHFASEGRISVTLYYLPREPMQGDVDNIVKPILDALSRHIFIDDRQVERILVQKFEPGNVFGFARPSEAFAQALEGEKPILYVRVSNDPFEDLV